MMSSVLSSALNPIVFAPIHDKIDMLQFFGKLTDSVTDTDQYRLVNTDYIEKNEDMCYNIDEDIVSDLINKGSDPNSVERSGETPLSLAIYLQNERIIDTLLRSGSKVIFEPTISGFDKNIYIMSFQNFLNSIDTSPILNTDEINDRITKHLSKKIEISEMYTNNDIILKMAAYLFDHQLTANANLYPNMWDRAQHKQILSLLGLGNNEILPLANVDTSIIATSIQGYSTINDTIDDVHQKLEKELEIDLRLENSIRNMNIELNEGVPNSQYRHAELRRMIIELEYQRENVKRNITSYSGRIRDLETTKTAINNIPQTTQVKHSLNTSNRLFKRLQHTTKRDICNIYDIFFNEILGIGALGIGALTTDTNEYTTYIKIWKELLSRTEREKVTDHTQMITNLQKYLIEQDVVDPEIFLDAYEPICIFYDKVLSKYSRDYLELSTYLSPDGTTNYNYNYVLKQIFCIMNHVFKHTMSVNFINTVAHLLIRQDKGQDDKAVIRNTYKAMISSGFVKHCVGVIPKQIIKIICKIAEGEKDPDLVLTVNDVLAKALDVLTINTFQTIDKSIIDLAKDKIIPFFTTYIETYTTEMYVLMIKQMKLFIVHNNWLRIIKLLADKALLEIKSRKS